MKKQIKLNNDVSVDIEKLIEGGMVILANSGGGKSYAIRRIAEQAVPNVQVIILDPEGEFASLREKFDFILAGKDADVPVEVRSASMLAIKLLEIEKSAIIDLYELHPQERQRFVKLFCEAIVNCPKNLYHPVLIILDEAHEYVPEGKPSEATWAVELLASKGRKRGQRLILASQRIAKISKNVTAEANNKLIGRASQDIDMKRAGDELGFSKDKLVEIRQLKPGEFFVFGNAISDEVQKIKIGEVKTAHAKVGYQGSSKNPAPSAVIKKVLAELKDLPKEAEKELKTVAEYKTKIRDLETKLKHIPQKNVESDPKAIEKAVTSAVFGRDKEWAKIISEWSKYASGIHRAIANISEKFSSPKLIRISPNEFVKAIFEPKVVINNSPKKHIIYTTLVDDMVEKSLGKGEKIMLTAIAQSEDDGISQEHIAVLTGYKATSRSVYTQSLMRMGFIVKENDLLKATEAGIEALGDFEKLPTGPELREHLMHNVLPEGEKRIMQVLIDAYPEYVTYIDIETATGYKSTSRSVYLQKLTARKLVERNKTSAKASAKLFDQ